MAPCSNDTRSVLVDIDDDEPCKGGKAIPLPRNVDKGVAHSQLNITTRADSCIETAFRYLEDAPRSRSPRGWRRKNQNFKHL